MSDHMPRRGLDADANPAPATSATSLPGARRLIAVLLLATAALNLSRCGLVLATPRHPVSTVGLAAAALAAVLSGWTARGCLGWRRWPTWTALLIGAASAPQAAASGFHGPYPILDTATATLGILLAITVLATADSARQPGAARRGP